MIAADFYFVPLFKFFHIPETFITCCYLEERIIFRFLPKSDSKEWLSLQFRLKSPEKPFAVVLIISGYISPNHSQATLSFLQETGHFIVPF